MIERDPLNNLDLAVLIEKLRGEVGEKLARLQEQGSAARDASDRQHHHATTALKNLSDKIEKLALKEDVDALDTRVSGIESTHRKIATGAIVGTSIGGGILYALGKKLGLTS